jgi:DNA (cytosine-5)-methyltransferase 1
MTGEVDERDIRDVQPSDLAGFRHCHFFAGIGGWPLALRLAGWPDEWPVWTGSCPCQPFSAAGLQQGTDDPRHLWPAWFRLIHECRPSVIFGEQVTGAIGHGWLDLVFDDLEGEGYACGAAVLPACSVGAPHLRQRLWFVADSGGAECRSGRTGWGGKTGGRAHAELARSSDIGGLGDVLGAGLEGWASQRPDDAGECEAAQRASGESGGMGNTTLEQARRARQPRQDFWRACDWLPCRDGKARPVEPSTFPLAYGVPSRVGRLRAYGNAIVPQVASAFIKAYLEARREVA